MDVNIELSWKQELADEFEKPYFAGVVNFLKQEKQNGKIIYPPGNLIFNAFSCTPFRQVKVVILGQDPYINPGQAQGLCFSVPDNFPFPPSLVNIFKELEQDLHFATPKSGNLEQWARQGVFLLNATLTVEAEKSNSHASIGWQTFTDQVIKLISERREKVVFILWGKFAQNKEVLIDGTKHKILKAAHPSPLSAYNGFFGCRHFSKANEWLKEQDMEPINWQL